MNQTMMIRKLIKSTKKNNNSSCKSATINISITQYKLVKFLVKEGYAQNNSELCRLAIQEYIDEIKQRKALTNLVDLMIKDDKNGDK